MKIKTEAIIIMSLTVLGVVGWTGAISSHATQTPTPRGSIILQGFQTWERVNSTQTRYTGLGLYCSSSSEGGPEFPAPLINSDGSVGASIKLTDAIAQCLSLQYHIDHYDGLNVYLSR